MDSRDRDESSRRARAFGSGGRRNERAARYDAAINGSFSSKARSSRSRSPGKRSRSPEKAPVFPRSLTGDANLADRRYNHRPPPINVDSARQYVSVTKKAVVVEEPHKPQSQYAIVNSPVTPPLRRMPKMMSPSREDDNMSVTSSYYSEDELTQAHPSYVSPLRVRKDFDSDTSILQCYTMRDKSPSPERTKYNNSPVRRSPQGRGLQKTATMGDLHEAHSDESRLQRTYSPLSDYLSVQAMPMRKQLVGAHGWLERTTNTSEKQTCSENKKPSPRAVPQKKGGFLDSLKKMAKEMTTSAKDITASASRKSRDKDQQASRLTVSLDPREQSLLYCELEFLLTTALDGYITSQFNAGRLDADKYKKVVDGWQQRGRPKVVGFRYDLETQLDLVLFHSQEFRFYGKRAGLIAAVNGVLDMMRVDARAMRIRTFCQPDTVIAKQLLDSQSLFNLIGCYEQQQIQLAEVIQFFKVILEREQNFRQYHTEEGAGAVATDPADQSGQQYRSSGGTGPDPGYEHGPFMD
ncbi:hypothetical protein VMCG_04455 [Cytospora schulzeri]|uniref:Uncharacterized protein n=1 Tax=Cytospora schulzeri TaxID=448051 RepID=A0A423WTE9_9PEZI|nr:hypothetical protein VMCG_04455 [Valsa malicola]